MGRCSGNGVGADAKQGSAVGEIPSRNRIHLHSRRDLNCFRKLCVRCVDSAEPSQQNEDQAAHKVCAKSLSGICKAECERCEDTTAAGAEKQSHGNLQVRDNFSGGSTEYVLARAKSQHISPREAGVSFSVTWMYELNGTSSYCQRPRVYRHIRVGPVPTGCGENWAILRCRPRPWSQQSLRPLPARIYRCTLGKTVTRRFPRGPGTPSAKGRPTQEELGWGVGLRHFSCFSGSGCWWLRQPRCEPGRILPRWQAGPRLARWYECLRCRSEWAGW